jgi:hypothetical protein
MGGVLRTCLAAMRGHEAVWRGPSSTPNTCYLHTAFWLPVDFQQILRPVRRDSSLRIVQRHPAGSDLASEIILNTIFDLEVPVFECYSIRTAFRLDVAKAIGAPEF